MTIKNWHFSINKEVAVKCVSLSSAILLTGCVFGHSAPAPVVDLGLNTDSKTGAIMVREGDTLWSISKRYRLPLRAIIDLNGLSTPYALNEGQRLKMPAPLDYRVRASDTLYSISNMFHVSTYELVKLNNIPTPYRISIGEYIRIPSKFAVEDTYEDNSALVDTSDDRVEIVKGVKQESVEREALSSPKSRVIKENNLLIQKAKVAEERPKNIVVNSGKKGKFLWPVRGKVISNYGAKNDGLFNDGVNIAVPKDSPVVAASDGVVAYVGDDLKSYGNLVLIKHSGGFTTAYAHLNKITVKKGDRISSNQTIGLAGTSGNVSVPQLHFEIRKGAKTYDPKSYL